MVDPLEALLGDISEARDNAPAAYANQDPEMLKNQAITYLRPYTFKPGDLVQWKPGMKNRRWPEYGEPVVVIEVMDPPQRNMNDGGSPYYMEPMSIRAGIIDKRDDEFAVYAHDGNRFEPYTH